MLATTRNPRDPVAFRATAWCMRGERSFPRTLSFRTHSWDHPRSTHARVPAFTLARCDILDRMWGLDSRKPRGSAPVDDVRPSDAHSMKGDSAPSQRRFLFVHLQKTGGTALFQRLREHFGPRGVYPTPDEQGDVRAVTDLDFLVDRLRVHGDDVRVVTGHFPLCTTELLGGGFTTFTVLRDPVERTLSLLRRRQHAEERFHGRDLEDIYADDSLRDIIRNHMVKMLSLTVDEVASGPLVMPRRVRSRHDSSARNPTCETESTCSGCKSTSTTSVSTSRTGSTGISVRLGSRTGRSARR